ncbi:HlyD family efflux transporter periplasmic adaptor subunit [Clostridium sp. P21]|uniref:HlyD family efflux transporter periplasmic adaptor subunit n=1 Tax=Clostridium muellerianum TaxID=2716538 RepID=A0A7Y0EGC6_9CLOT|nr:efflux RND transporter periplasmic adaptor subunit [Clostridium muellerianum]NMM62989.1 HlyD family efflux transporter periplasmic adaptor subunit [Clostridium muellerianum]
MKKVIFILVFSLLLGGCSSAKTEVGENYKAQAASREVFIFSGKIQANDSTNLASKIAPTKVSKVAVDVGSKVNAGDPIIYLDTTDLDQQVKQAEAKVNTARANLSKVESAARPEDIAITEAKMASDDKILQNAESSYNRVKQLYDKGYDTKQNIEQVEATLNAAKNTLTSDNENLSKLKNGSTQQEINVAQAAVKEAETFVDSYKTQLGNGVIKSPISGVVSVCNIHEGEIAATGANLVTVVNNDGLYIDGYVPEDILSELKIGQEVIVKVSNMPEKRFKGEISVINPIMNSNNKNVVRVTLKDECHVLKQGMIAQIGFNK